MRECVTIGIVDPDAVWHCDAYAVAVKLYCAGYAHLHSDSHSDAYSDLDPDSDAVEGARPRSRRREGSRRCNRRKRNHNERRQHGRGND